MACVAERPKRGSSRRVVHVTDPVLSDGAASYTPSISERRGTATTFLHSGLKNADAQTSAAGSVSGTRVYDAFGAELSSTGSWQGAFGYAGGFGYQEDANGFKLLGHRYYDPSTGRFLTRDPAKDGRNWYAYCENSPSSQVDSDGLRTTIVYRLLDSAGNLIKNGITRNAPRRLGEHRRAFDSKYGEVRLEEIARFEDEIPEGTKYGPQSREALEYERGLPGGPENRERYRQAGFGFGGERATELSREWEDEAIELLKWVPGLGDAIEAQEAVKDYLDDNKDTWRDGVKSNYMRRAGISPADEDIDW